MQTLTFGTMEYEAAESIRVPHAFTTRLGGVSTGHLASLNIGTRRGDAPENVARNYALLGDALGFDPKNTVHARQTHSDIVLRVTESCAGAGLYGPELPECDALITNTAGLALTVFTADCTPILLWDPVTGAVGAAHAGWRGTAAGIAGKTALAMAEAFGCDVKRIRAAIGPNIGDCCFETDADVPQAMANAYGEAAEKWIRRSGEKFYVNLKEINALSLRSAGVEHIEISSSCTACNPHRFWSHRVTKGIRGSQGAIIVCREVTP